MADDQNSEQDVADEWAAALAEQEGDGTAAPSVEDDWAAAMAEQASEPEPAPSRAPANVAPANIFNELTPGPAPSAPQNLDMILDIPVSLTVELGRTKIA